LTAARTHSRKTVVSTDKLLKDSSFTDLSGDEKLRRARYTEEVAQVKNIEQEFIAKMKTNQQLLALLKKQEAKKKKSCKVLLVLEECKNH